MPIKIRDQKWDESADPLVSIVCLTYNHEEFISDAVESFLDQETTFRVEILIHDDASTDSTAKIVKSYKEKFPFTIKTVLQDENQFSILKNPEVDHMFPLARGTYIALCEGDDYWSDNRKLQKQIDLLEQHPEYALCVGGYTSLEQDSGKETELIDKRESISEENGFEFTFTEMKEKWLTKTLTAVFRRNLLSEFDLSEYNHFRDIHLFYHLLKNRKGFYMKDNLGVYRIHAGGINSMNQGVVNNTAAYNCYRELYRKNRDEFTRVMYLRHTLNLLNYYIYNKNPAKVFFRLFVEALKLVRRATEMKWMVAVFFKKSWKEKVKRDINNIL